MTARSCVFQIYQPNFSGWNASSSLTSDCFFVCFFFISIREKSDQILFFSVFWMQLSITSPYFLKLLPICTGEEESLLSAGLKGGPGGHVPPRRGCECPKKYNIFHALYDITSIYTVMHTYKITDYPPREPPR